KYESSAILKIGSYARDVRFRIIEDLAFEVILGANWLRSNAISCSWATNAVELPTGERVPMLETSRPWAVHLSMTASQTEQIRQLINRYRHVFAVDPKRPNRIDFVQHRIDTGDNPPFRIPLRRRSPMEHARISSDVRQMLANGIVVESNSPFASPATLVP